MVFATVEESLSDRTLALSRFFLESALNRSIFAIKSEIGEPLVVVVTVALAEKPELISLSPTFTLGRSEVSTK